MATDGSAFDRWLREAGVARRKLTPEQIAVLQSSFRFLEQCGRDYYSLRLLGHYLLHCGLGLKVAQIARLVGVSRPTASEQQHLSSKEVVQMAHHRMAGKPHGKMLPRYAGPVAQFLITHPKASRMDILDFIERTWQVRVSTVALYHFMKKYGLDKAQRSLVQASANSSGVQVLDSASNGRPDGGPPVPSPAPEFFLPARTTRGRSSSCRRP